MTTQHDALQADQFLVDEIRRGSEAGWRNLIARYQGRLLAFARSPYCKANLDDLRAEADETPSAHLEQRLFTFSVGFLSHPASPE